MKLEDQVCSLELAKRLKELVVKQESYFYWSGRSADAKWRIESKQIFNVDRTSDVSAFTVAELGEMLHAADADLCISTVSLDFDGIERLWTVTKIGQIEHIEANSKRHRAGVYELYHLDHVEAEQSEADARAKMLIYLIENKQVARPHSITD